MSQTQHRLRLCNVGLHASQVFATREKQYAYVFATREKQYAYVFATREKQYAYFIR